MNKTYLFKFEKLCFVICRLDNSGQEIARLLMQWLVNVVAWVESEKK